MGLLSGLEGLGLDHMEGMDIFEETEKEKLKKKDAVKTAPKVIEKNLIYDKSFECPVCGCEFSAKIMKTGRAKLLGTDDDLRARYDGIDPVKYDVELCPTCGYAALSRFFPHVSSAQAKLIRQEISAKVKMVRHTGETYSYKQAYDRYLLALACAVAKKARTSEKAYICLKIAWLSRGWRESLQENGEPAEQQEKKLLKELERREEEYLQNAYKGFTEAMKTEEFPMCGLDEYTLEYLLAVLAVRFREYDMASRLVSGILTSSGANMRIKDKARDLKTQILAGKKKG